MAGLPPSVNWAPAGTSPTEAQVGGSECCPEKRLGLQSLPAALFLSCFSWVPIMPATIGFALRAVARLPWERLPEGLLRGSSLPWSGSHSSPPFEGRPVKGKHNWWGSSGTLPPVPSSHSALGRKDWERLPGRAARGQWRGGMLTSLLAMPPPLGAGAWVKCGPERAPSRGPDPPPSALPSHFHHITTTQPKPEPPLSREVT